MHILKDLIKQATDQDTKLLESAKYDEFARRVMRACKDLNDNDRLALAAALNCGHKHARDSDFIKQHGTVAAEILY